MAHWLMNPTRNHEVAGLIPGLGGRPGATAPNKPQAGEPPKCGGRGPKKRKKKKKKKKKGSNLAPTSKNGQQRNYDIVGQNGKASILYMLHASSVLTNQEQ